MGDRLIAATNAYKRAPAGSSKPVLIDALRPFGQGPSGSLGEGRPRNAVEAEVFPRALCISRGTRRSGSTRHGTRADGVDGRDVAKLRQLCENQQNRQELFAFGADAT